MPEKMKDSENKQTVTMEMVNMAKTKVSLMFSGEYFCI